MAVMAKWRDMTFEVSRTKINPLKNFSISSKIKEDKNAQQTLEPSPIDFEVDLHANAGIDIQKEHKAWLALIGQTDFLYLNIQRFAEIKLKGVSLSNVLLDDFGRFRFATLTLNFIEHKRQNPTSGARSAPSAAQKAEKKPQKPKDKKETIAVGSRVKVYGSTYIGGAKIPTEHKSKVLTVSKINGNQAYLSPVNSWVYLKALSLVP